MKRYAVLLYIFLQNRWLSDDITKNGISYQAYGALERSIKKDKNIISTFAFVDLEATGLGGLGKKPRITEITILAVHRDSFLDELCGEIPRVINKITLCVYPMKPVEPDASRITGEYSHRKIFLQLVN